jgi:hypothetical protein
MIDDDLRLLRVYAALGVRYMTLAHGRRRVVRFRAVDFFGIVARSGRHSRWCARFGSRFASMACGFRLINTRTTREDEPPIEVHESRPFDRATALASVRTKPSGSMGFDRCT